MPAHVPSPAMRSGGTFGTLPAATAMAGALNEGDAVLANYPLAVNLLPLLPEPTVLPVIRITPAPRAVKPIH